MKRFFSVLGFGFGLATGGGLIYALLVSESARLMITFLLGALVFGGTVLITTILVNRQWTKAIGEQRSTYNHRYQVYPQQPSSPMGPAMWSGQPEALLPPPASTTTSWAQVPEENQVDDEVVA
jgi:Flp pilus assembly protein protease CpaA